jgi:hypothetical protein
MNDDRPVSAHRHVVPAFTLFGTGRYALDKARRTNKGSRHELLTAVLMAALAFEAFLNQAGQYTWGVESQAWAAVERLSPMDKLKAIAERAGFPLDLGVRPVQTLSAVCRFRNDIVHAKPEYCEAEIARGVAAANPLLSLEELSARWERDCTVEFAERALGDLEELTDLLSQHLRMSNPLHFGGLAGWSE